MNRVNPKGRRNKVLNEPALRQQTLTEDYANELLWAVVDSVCKQQLSAIQVFDFVVCQKPMWSRAVGNSPQ